MAEPMCTAHRKVGSDPFLQDLCSIVVQVEIEKTPFATFVVVYHLSQVRLRFGILQMYDSPHRAFHLTGETSAS